MSKFKTLRKLFWRIVIGKGVALASDNLYKKRIGICRENSCGVYKNPMKLNLLEKCGDCGCFLKVKNRIDESFIECPKNLW